MNVRPAGREACECASPINQILERLDQMDADIASAQQAANTAVGTATAQAGAAAASAASAQADAAAALINAGAAQDAADDAHDEAVAAAGSAQDAADDAADALLALQNIESTIASVLATDIGAKVDKLTTAGFHLYTHNGSTQGEVAPDINPTAATIPIRDSSGKLFGADPASGATDKTLVTANWVSQTGNSSPNNLAHKNGSDTISAVWEFTEYPRRIMKYRDFNISQSSSKPWVKLFSPSTSRRQIRGRIWDTSTMVWFLIDNQSNTAPLVKIYGFGVIPVQSIAATFNTGDSNIDIWFKTENYRSTKIFIDDVGNYGGSQAYSVLNPVNTPVYETAPTGEYITYSSLGTVIS